MMLSSMLSFKKLLKAVYVIRPGIQLIPYLAEEAAVDVSVVQSRTEMTFRKVSKLTSRLCMLRTFFNMRRHQML